MKKNRIFYFFSTAFLPHTSKKKKNQARREARQFLSLVRHAPSLSQAEGHKPNEMPALAAPARRALCSRATREATGGTGAARVAWTMPASAEPRQRSSDERRPRRGALSAATSTSYPVSSSLASPPLPSLRRRRRMIPLRPITVLASARCPVPRSRSSRRRRRRRRRAAAGP